MVNATKSVQSNHCKWAQQASALDNASSSQDLVTGGYSAKNQKSQYLVKIFNYGLGHLIKRYDFQLPEKAPWGKNIFFYDFWLGPSTSRTFQTQIAFTEAGTFPGLWRRVLMFFWLGRAFIRHARSGWKIIRQSFPVFDLRRYVTKENRDRDTFRQPWMSCHPKKDFLINYDMKRRTIQTGTVWQNLMDWICRGKGRW